MILGSLADAGYKVAAIDGGIKTECPAFTDQKCGASQKLLQRLQILQNRVQHVGVIEEFFVPIFRAFMA